MNKEICLRTNELKAQLSLEAVIRDFDIFLVEPVDPDQIKPSEPMPCLDDPILSIKKASAVSFDYKSCYVLLPKDALSEESFYKQLTYKYPAYKVRRLREKELRDEKFREKHFFYADRLLVQLLFNYLNTFYLKSDKALYFSNVFGQLLYPISKASGDSRTFLEIKLQPGMYLSLPVVTYTKQKPEYLPKKEGRRGEYVHITNNLVTPWHVGEKSRRNVYKKCSPYGNHNVVDFLDYKSLNAFLEKSKCGVLCQFLHQVQDHLADYVSLSFVSHQAEEYSLKDWEKQQAKQGLPPAERIHSRDWKAQGNILYSKPFYLSMQLPEAVEREGRWILPRIRQELANFYDVDAIVTKAPVQGDCFNLILIEDKDWYASHELEDPYRTLHKAFPEAQFFTVTETKELLTQREQDESEATSPLENIKKIVLELVVKQDIKVGRTSFMEPVSGLLTKPMYFVAFHKPPKSASGTYHPFTDQVVTYFVLRLDPDGSLSFHSFEDKELDKSEQDWSIYRAVKGFYRKSNEADSPGLRQPSEDLERLYYTEGDPNLYGIIKSQGFMLPDIEQTWQLLCANNPKSTQSRQALLDFLTAFQQSLSKEEQPDIDFFLEALPKDEEFRLGEYTKAVKGKFRKQTQKKLLQSLFSSEHILADVTKGQWMQQQMGVEAARLCHFYRTIRPLYRQGEKFGEIPALAYTCGLIDAPSKKKMARATLIRHIINMDPGAQDAPLPESVLPLCAFSFVRASLYSVLPFPFKYLREYARIYCLRKGVQLEGLNR